MKKVLSIICFPLALFAQFTWKWWERQWKGNALQKVVHIALWPLYGLLYIILNYTHPQ